MLHSLFMFSFFRSSPLQKESEAKKTKGCNKGGMSQVSKSVSVDGQKNADKNWSVQPSSYIMVTIEERYLIRPN